ncbi:MAG: hypothetical protein K0M45_04750 [Candidatus Paracaedibacteraceae bacterium]|nr:hypothetical protein [Candidatus Paracaedibacteraceae bacterium]
MKFSGKRNNLRVFLSLGGAALSIASSIAMDSASQADDIKTTLFLAQDFHQQAHEDQQFGYVKFDIKLDDKTSITPWVILPDSWIPAFNGHLHAYHPEINSEVCIKTAQAPTIAPSLNLPEQFFQDPIILGFENELHLYNQLKKISDELNNAGSIVPVVVMSQHQKSKFIDWVEKTHPDLLHPKPKTSLRTPEFSFPDNSRDIITQKLLWKILGGARKGARTTTKIALGTVSATVGGTAGLVIGTTGAPAGGVIYSLGNQMRDVIAGGRSSHTPALDFLIGTALSPFIGAGLGGYYGAYLMNIMVDSIDGTLFGK